MITLSAKNSADNLFSDRGGVERVVQEGIALVEPREQSCACVALADDYCANGRRFLHCS
jgi:hypothetical protein